MSSDGRGTFSGFAWRRQLCERTSVSTYLDLGLQHDVGIPGVGKSEHSPKAVGREVANLEDLKLRWLSIAQRGAGGRGKEITTVPICSSWTSMRPAMMGGFSPLFSACDRTASAAVRRSARTKHNMSNLGALHARSRARVH